MHPVLVELGKLRVYSYGLMLALSFFIGILLASRRAERRGIEKEILFDLCIILVIASVIGSRGLYIITHRDHYHSLLDIVALWQGGATYYGGLVLAIICAVVFVRRKRIPFFRVADICAPSIALGVFLTRVGCFLSGCCFGRPTECVLGLVFPNHSPAGYTFSDTHIHPTQLYSSFYGLVIFGLLMVLDRWNRFDGFTFSLLCILYGIARFIVDFFRFYESTSMVGDFITVSQVTSLALVLAGVLLLVVLPRLPGNKPGRADM
ncbi:MAG: prolipoprotein diacylglyceryl transferase [bacterium]|nr:MAG: prolipoprotein diacylglyceryl transferase [bacterium]